MIVRLPGAPLYLSIQSFKAYRGHSILTLPLARCGARLLRPPSRDVLIRQDSQDLRSRRRGPPSTRNTKRVPAPPPRPPCPATQQAAATHISNTPRLLATKEPSGPSPGHTPNTATSSPRPPTTAKCSSGASNQRAGSKSTPSPHTLRRSTW